MEKNPFQILASSVEDFNKLEAAAQVLPDKIRTQIERVETWFHGGTKLIFKKAYGDTNKIVLPANLIALTYTKTEVHINTPDFIIYIPYDKDTLFQFEFIPVTIIKEK